MPNLKRYHEKRDPGATPEPFGEDRAPRPSAGGAPRVFVVQQHAARRMHWDLRLEINDALASWAVPRGPSLDPADKRLAVRTEDHPLEYADFEGVIPDGNYGAGAMIVWDRGVYRSADGVAPEEALEAGKLDLQLDGHKLRGRFALVRTRGGGHKDWLLIRKGHGEAGIVDREPASVLSGLTVDELRAGADHTEEIRAQADAAGAPARMLDPGQVRPMLAQLGGESFSDAEWIYELKHDGVRVLLWKTADGVQLVSRRGRNVTGIYPEITRALPHLPVADCVLDGELVALDAAGRSSFERIQRRFTLKEPADAARAEAEVPVRFFAFDLLAAAGRDLRGLPLLRRKELLAQVVPRTGIVRYEDHIQARGAELFELAVADGREGVVAKRSDSKYLAGKRSEAWLKLKAPRKARLAIVGWTAGQGARARLGALLVAGHRDGAWVYCGAVGSGLDDATIDALLPRLEALACHAPSFTAAPDLLPGGARFTRPELSVEVRFTEVTDAGLLRQPVFLELGPEATPEGCPAPSARSDVSLAEPPPPPPASSDDLRLTRLDKVFWPADGTTKGDLLRYYEAVWPWLAPYLEDRPVVLTRYPDGIEGKSFYQKNAPDFTPAWARRENIEGTDYFVCNDLRTLLYVINLGAIPLHVWSARLGRLDRPDWLIVDLDPKGAPFADVVKVARHVHRLLEGLGAPHYVKSSGQDGIHVMLPLGGALDHGDTRRLAEVLARVVCADLPEIATLTRPVAARGGKVYVDWLQNGRGKLIAAPLSVRPRPGAPVSMPLTWRQVTRRLDPGRWNLRTAPGRLAERGDPFADVLETAADVPALLEALGARLASKQGRE